MGAAMMEQFAARGDRVIATGRSATVRLADKKSSNIFPLDLDATAPLAVVREQIEKAIQVFGYIDFVVNNAGISVPQTIEEADDAFTQKMLDTNLIGAIRLVQAVLPHFRERKAVKSEGMASGKPFPIRVPLGLDALAVIRQKCYEQLRLCDEWEKVALSTTKDGADTTPNKYLLEKMSIMNLTK
ncbi:hypothetical protein KNSL1_004266 [Colletotrichum chrysophilum]|nr:hypothetical protein KNSL1_004266 [Colletotrichum chrysophilum]